MVYIIYLNIVLYKGTLSLVKKLQWRWVRCVSLPSSYSPPLFLPLKTPPPLASVTRIFLFSSDLCLCTIYSPSMAPLPPIILKPYLSLQTLPALSSVHALSLRLPLMACLPLMTTKYLLLWAKIAFQIFKMKIFLLTISSSVVHGHLKHKMYKPMSSSPTCVPSSASTCSAGISFSQRETLGFSETSPIPCPKTNCLRCLMEATA